MHGSTIRPTGEHTASRGKVKDRSTENGDIHLVGHIRINRHAYRNLHEMYETFLNGELNDDKR